MAQIILDSNNNLIQGDFDNATLNNRTKLQTTTTNATTNVYVVPNGSSTSAGVSVANNSSLTNASKIVMATNGSTDTQIISGVNGSGTYLPLSFYVNNALAMQLSTAGVLTVTGGIAGSSLPAGSVIQVVQGSTSTSVMTNNTTATDTGLSASITPSSASNKILVIVAQNYYIQGGNPNSGSILLLRGSTTIGTTGDYPIWTTAGTNIGGIYTINYLDSPATTSSVTYKTRQKLRDGAEMFTQRDSVTASTITLMEIKV